MRRITPKQRRLEKVRAIRRAVRGLAKERRKVAGQRAANISTLGTSWEHGYACGVLHNIRLTDADAARWRARLDRVHAAKITRLPTALRRAA